MDSLSHHLSPPFTGCSPVASQAVRSSTTFSDSCDMCIVACWLITATSSRSSRSRFVDSPPSWRTSLVASVYLNRTFSPRPLNLLCHAVLLMSGDLLMVSGSVPVRIRSPSWLSTGGLRRSCPRAARSPRRLSRSFLRFLPTGPPGADGLSVSFVVAVWPPLPRERPTHQL